MKIGWQQDTRTAALPCCETICDKTPMETGSGGVAPPTARGVPQHQPLTTTTTVCCFLLVTLLLLLPLLLLTMTPLASLLLLSLLLLFRHVAAVAVTVALYPRSP